MKTTFDLPPDLVRAVKFRAVHEGRKLKDVAADLLRRGLASPEPSAGARPVGPKIETLANGVPVVQCKAEAPATRMSTEELLALEQQPHPPRPGWTPTSPPLPSNIRPNSSPSTTTSRNSKKKASNSSS